MYEVGLIDNFFTTEAHLWSKYLLKISSVYIHFVYREHPFDITVFKKDLNFLYTDMECSQKTGMYLMLLFLLKIYTYGLTYV